MLMPITCGWTAKTKLKMFLKNINGATATQALPTARKDLIIYHLVFCLLCSCCIVPWSSLCCPSHRGRYSDAPRLTRVSWKQWRKQPRTSVTTWTLPKAWTPTKTRSITLQTAWPRLCDLLPCLSPPVSLGVIPHKPPLLPLFLIYPTVWPAPPLSNPRMPVTLLHLQPCVKCVWLSLSGLLCLPPSNQCPQQ